MAEVKEVVRDAVEAIKPLAPLEDKDQDASSQSGSENGEKPVREKLKNTELDETVVEDEKPPEITNGSATRPHPPTIKKKRSYEDLIHNEDGAEPVTPSDGAHARKKTREARTPIDIEKGSSLRHSVTNADDEARHSDAESDKVIVTPPSSGDEAMLDAAGGSKLRKKRSSDEMLGSQDVLRSPKVAATDAERERRSSSAPLSDDESKITKTNEITKIEAPRSVPKELESDAKATAATMPAVSGFGNTSSTSPFASLGSGDAKKPTDKDLPQTSASAFAGSGFAKLVNSGSSFGSLAPAADSSTEQKAQASASPFASSGFASLSGTASAFGTAAGSKPTSVLGASPFAAPVAQSSFGGGSVFGSGFGSAFGSGSKLSSFAAPVSDLKPTASTASKAFGAPETVESDGEDDGEDENESDVGEGEEAESFGGAPAEGSSHFKIRNDQSTGEEGELTAFLSPTATLYQFSGQWAERGKGPFKLNYKSNSTDPEAVLEELLPGEDKIDARFIMRNAATHKVIINAGIFKEMKIGTQAGEEPTDKSRIFFSAMSETGMSLYLLKLGKKENTMDLYDQVKRVQEFL